jgi:hypothetical protein
MVGKILQFAGTKLSYKNQYLQALGSYVAHLSVNYGRHLFHQIDSRANFRRLSAAHPSAFDILAPAFKLAAADFESALKGSILFIPWDRCHDLKKYFSQKMAIKLAVLIKNEDKLCKNFTITLVSEEKNRRFFSAKI